MKFKIKNSKLVLGYDRGLKIRQRVVVAMSGGLDSSTVAKMLIEKGYECIGVFMRLGIEGSCCDEGVARRVCQKLGIKFYPVNIAGKFKKEIKDYFLNAYQKGTTPNPCVKCNKFIKFGELFKIAKKLEADYLATGHYIKLKKEASQYKILRPRDRTKDQTYFLYNLTQNNLKHILFPLGDSIKEKIREQAKKESLPHMQKESQDVCFLDGDHNNYLKLNLKLKKGPIKTIDGKTVGEHQGLPLYTIGQRKGIEIGGIGPFYALKADYKTNTLYVTNDSKDPKLFKSILKAKEVNWISGKAPYFPFKCNAMIRYGHKEQPCIINNKLEVKFKEPQRAITPGQSVVFYKNNELLGGGTITS